MQTQSEQTNELVAALLLAQMAMEPVKKERENPFFHSKYADLSACWQSLLPFREQGIVITQSPMEAPDGFILLDTQLTHTSGQWMRSRLKMRVAKDDPQGYGSALTYARRYALGCMTGLVTEEDDDGNVASMPTFTPERPAMKATAAKPAAPPPTPSVGGFEPCGTAYPFAPYKGLDLSDPKIGLRDLEWCAGVINSHVRDESKAKYRERNEELALALAAEIDRRAMLGGGT